MKRNWKKKIPLIIGFSILAVTGFTFAVMALWNSVLVPVVHVSMVTFWQAAGILLLAKLLFGRGHHRHMGHCHTRRMQMKWKEHFESLTPEQRQAFKNNYKMCYVHSGC